MNGNELKVLDIDDQKCFLVDSLVGNGITYCFFSEMEKDGEVYVLKSIFEDGEEVLISVDDSVELDYAFSLFHEKYKDYEKIN